MKPWAFFFFRKDATFLEMLNFMFGFGADVVSLRDKRRRNNPKLFHNNKGGQEEA